MANEVVNGRLVRRPDTVTELHTFWIDDAREEDAYLVAAMDGTNFTV